MIEEVLRVLGGMVVCQIVGFCFYNPNFNPLAKIWLRFQSSTKHSDGMVRELTGTWLANIAIAIFLLHYTGDRNYQVFDLVCLSAKFTFMSTALLFTHYMWKQGAIGELVINSVYDFLIVFVIAFAVAYKRNVMKY